MGSLDPTDHGRGPRSLVYPVWSRRAGGLSVGINLNPGKECNWGCVYCEVEGLVRGAPAPIDLALLEHELNDVLAEAIGGRWLAGNAPRDSDPRSAIRDISIAGDGEPTLSDSYGDAVRIMAEARDRHRLIPGTQLVTITNGSRATRPAVLRAFETLADAGGEIWFKLDGGTEAVRERINRVSISDDRVVAGLVAASGCVPTWIQTMLLAQDGAAPTDAEVDALVALIERARSEGARPRGILVYGLARPSHQPGGERLSALPPAVLESLAVRLEASGLPARAFV